MVGLAAVGEKQNSVKKSHIAFRTVERGKIDEEPR
jgi:hypothetical protein